MQREITFIIIPCFNEEKRLDLLQFELALKQCPDFYLYFVDDCSFDDTPRIIEEFRKKFPDRVVVQTLQKNVGKGEAIRTAALLTLNNYDFKYLVYIDADLSVPFSQISAFTRIIQEHKNLKMLLGSRIKKIGSFIKRKSYRHYFGRIIATIVSSIILKIPIYDSQCGIKMFDKSIVSDLFDKPFLTKWMFDVEIISRYISRYGFEEVCPSFIEVPVDIWVEKAGSKIGLKDLIKVPPDLVKLYFSHKMKI